MAGHGSPRPDDEAENPKRKVAEYTSFINKGGTMTGVSDEEYNTWRTNRKAHQEVEDGLLGGEYWEAVLTDMVGYGSPPPDDQAHHPNRDVSRLKSDVTRWSNKAQKIEDEYGAHDIPKTSPLHAKVTQARQRHQEALTAYVNATKGA